VCQYYETKGDRYSMLALDLGSLHNFLYANDISLRSSVCESTYPMRSQANRNSLRCYT
jgi:hypothetical protein